MKSERLTLRAYRPNDAGWAFRLYSRPDISRYLLDNAWTEATAREKVAQRQSHTDLNGPAAAVALVIEHRMAAIGDVALWLPDTDRRVAEIGWVLDPNYGGRGFASEAVNATLRLAFDHYHLHRVSAQMDARNNPSAALARRVGMQHEAHLRQNWWSKGEWTDTLIFGMLATDR